MSELLDIEQSLDQTASVVDVFFRDDDAGWADYELVSLCRLFEQRAPLDVAVIPDVAGCALAAALFEFPLVHVHQHGFAHLNHQLTGKKCEFSDDRQTQDIVRDVRAGRVRMLELFGDRSDPIFTPPWNRCGHKAAAAAAEVGLRVLSRDRGARRLEVDDLIEVPVNVDWTRTGLAGIARALSVEVGPIGIMLHHQVLAAEDLAQLDDLLELLSAHHNVRLRSMLEIADGQTVDSAATEVET